MNAVVACIGVHNYFAVCDCCGRRGQYCFLEPLSRRAELCLELALEWIESNASDGRWFSTREIWIGGYGNYGMTSRVLKWLEHLGFIERRPTPPQIGNRWRIRETTVRR